MIKTATIYRMETRNSVAMSVENMEAALQSMAFLPCSALQDHAVGWVAPRGEDHGALVELVSGQRILKLMIETKSVPSAQIKQRAQEAADQIEATTGRKPGKKEIKNLRNDALLALLPSTFPRQAPVWIWIDRPADVLVIGSASQRQVDEAVTLLVRTFDQLSLRLLQTKLTPQTAMTQWLATTKPDTDWPEGFSVERECELKSSDESRAAVRFKNHSLQTEEVRKHLAEGKLPTRLAMSWESRVGFVLDEAMRLRKITFLEGVFEDRVDSDVGSGFDTDVALTTGELGKLIPALVSALGGEFNPGELA